MLANRDGLATSAKMSCARLPTATALEKPRATNQTANAPVMLHTLATNVSLSGAQMRKIAPARAQRPNTVPTASVTANLDSPEIAVNSRFAQMLLIAPAMAKPLATSPTALASVQVAGRVTSANMRPAPRKIVPAAAMRQAPGPTVHALVRVPTLDQSVSLSFAQTLRIVAGKQPLSLATSLTAPATACKALREPSVNLSCAQMLRTAAELVMLVAIAHNALASAKSATPATNANLKSVPTMKIAMGKAQQVVTDLVASVLARRDMPAIGVNLSYVPTRMIVLLMGRPPATNQTAPARALQLTLGIHAS